MSGPPEWAGASGGPTERADGTVEVPDTGSDALEAQANDHASNIVDPTPYQMAVIAFLRAILRAVQE